MNSICSTAPLRYLEVKPEQEKLQQLAAIPRTCYMKSEQFKNDKSGHKTPHGRNSVKEFQLLRTSARDLVAFDRMRQNTIFMLHGPNDIPVLQKLISTTQNWVLVTTWKVEAEKRNKIEFLEYSCKTLFSQRSISGISSFINFKPLQTLEVLGCSCLETASPVLVIQVSAVINARLKSGCWTQASW